MPGLRLKIFAAIVATFVVVGASVTHAQIFDPLQRRTSRPRTVQETRQLYPIEIDSKWGFIDASGKVIIKPQFDSKGQFHNGMAVVTSGGEHGYITHRGKFMPLKYYNRLFPFSEDRGRVSVPQPAVRSGPRKFKFTFVDKSGRNISPILFDNAGDFSEGMARIYLSHNANIGGRFIAESWGFINTQAQIVIRPQFKEVGDFSQGLARVNVEGRWGYIDKQGKIAIEPKFDYAEDFSDDLAVVEMSSKRGYVNKRGHFVIKPQFEYAGPFRENRAPVAQSLVRQFKFINARGKVVIDRKFEAAGTFSEGLARVYFGGKWGYINVDGEQTIEAMFDDAHDFNGELAMVSIGNNWGYINVEGKFVWRSDRSRASVD